MTAALGTVPKSKISFPSYRSRANRNITTAPCKPHPACNGDIASAPLTATGDL